MGLTLGKLGTSRLTRRRMRLSATAGAQDIWERSLPVEVWKDWRDSERNQIPTDFRSLFVTRPSVRAPAQSTTKNIWFPHFGPEMPGRATFCGTPVSHCRTR